MSIYASIEGIGDYGDPEHLGPPWTYQGSHIPPREDGPRSGSIGLAAIPSHITADGHDDQPADGPPGPGCACPCKTCPATTRPSSSTSNRPASSPRSSRRGPTTPTRRRTAASSGDPRPRPRTPARRRRRRAVVRRPAPMNGQLAFDDMTSDQLDQLYDRLKFTEDALARIRDRAEVTVARVRKAAANSFMAGPHAVDVVRVADILAALDDPKD